VSGSGVIIGSGVVQIEKTLVIYGLGTDVDVDVVVVVVVFVVVVVEVVVLVLVAVVYFFVQGGCSRRYGAQGRVAFPISVGC
jgi:hypothetical protein